ncbi:MAG: RNA methyltransferase [Gordonia sp. (in: high G+C Gram-positive bacteria)]|uniref:TrmH family RNA methyltransferase n=1 Tax=Gordonia sp. (in: high G+C Gram-positive bacteria) TaxID=84139 RepID=UPI003BB633E5
MQQPLTVHVVDLTDPADPRLDDFRDLNSADRRPDVGRGLAIAEGVPVVQRMIASRFAPHAFLGVGKRLAALVAAGSIAIDPHAPGRVPFYVASADLMTQVVGFHLNRGVLAVAHRPRPLPIAEVIDGARTVAILEGVNDHENIGSVFRNAAGLGVDALIFGGGCADPLYRRSIRVSMGHALLVPFAKYDTWPDDLDLLARAGFRLVALTPGAGSVPLSDAVGDRSGKIAFLVGAEGAGLTEETMLRCDVRAHIPMSRGTDSLNVATAAAIAFYARLGR